MSVLGQNKNMTLIVLVVTREVEEKGQEYSQPLTRSQRGVAANHAGPMSWVSIQETKSYFKGSRGSLKILCSEGIQVYLQ